MAGLVAITQALEKRLRDNIATLNLAESDVAWTNKRFDPKGKALWIRPTVRVADEQRETVALGDGSATGQVIDGLFILQVFEPEDAGAGRAHVCADAAKTLFNEKTLNLTGGGTLILIGRDGEAARREPIGPDGFGWYQVNVTIPWRHNVG